jgi:hypothetical protein
MALLRVFPKKAVVGRPVRRPGGMVGEVGVLKEGGSLSGGTSFPLTEGSVRLYWKKVSRGECGCTEIV